MKYVSIISALFVFNHITAATQIKAQILNEMAFWAQQYSEHAELASRFSQNKSLINEGMLLEKKINAFRSKLNINDKAVAEFNQISNDMKKYQNKVKSSLKKDSADPTVKIKIDLLDHMNLETDYAQKKANGKKFSKSEEIKFWSTEHEGEAKVMAAFMNPDAPELKDEAEDIASELSSTRSIWSPNAEPVQKANEELNEMALAFERTPNLNNIPAKLAKHEERERKRAAQILAQL